MIVLNYLSHEKFITNFQHRLKCVLRFLYLKKSPTKIYDFEKGGVARSINNKIKGIIRCF